MSIDHNAGEASLRRALRYVCILKDCPEKDVEGVLNTVREELSFARRIYTADETHVCSCVEGCSE